MKDLPPPSLFRELHREKEKKEQEQKVKFQKRVQLAQSLWMATAVKHLMALLRKEMQRTISSGAWEKTSTFQRGCGCGPDFVLSLQVTLPVCMSRNKNRYMPKAKALGLTDEEHAVFARDILVIENDWVRLCTELTLAVQNQSTWRVASVIVEKDNVVVTMEAKS